MKLKKLKKKIRFLYEKNNQHLYITTDVDLSYKPSFVDVWAVDKNGENYDWKYFLFEISTYEKFIGIDRLFKSYFREIPLRTVYFYGEIAYTPLYLRREFTLRKFGSVTEKDVYNCVKYLMKEVLGMWNIWNIELVK